MGTLGRNHQKDGHENRAMETAFEKRHLSESSINYKLSENSKLAHPIVGEENWTIDKRKENECFTNWTLTFEWFSHQWSESYTEDKNYWEQNQWSTSFEDAQLQTLEYFLLDFTKDGQLYRTMELRAIKEFFNAWFQLRT